VFRFSGGIVGTEDEKQLPARRQKVHRSLLKSTPFWRG
jgi:hypothetical protein